MLGFEIETEAGCKLGLLVEIETAPLEMVSGSFIVAVVATEVIKSVFWVVQWSALSESKAAFGLSFPKPSLTVLLCKGRIAMFCRPALSSNWLREVGVVRCVGETSESGVGAVWTDCLSTVPAWSSKSGLAC